MARKTCRHGTEKQKSVNSVEAFLLQKKMCIVEKSILWGMQFYYNSVYAKSNLLILHVTFILLDL